MTNHLAIEIGGTKLQLVVGSSDARILRRWRFVVQRECGGNGIREEIARVLPGILAEHDIATVGVGYGGPVDWRTGEICCSHQIEGWSGFPLGQWLSDQTGRPAFIDNDANVAAFGEAIKGAGQGRDPVFYVTLGSGVGGGLVVGGRIYHGAKPGEAEIGHVRLDKSGTIVEQRCSGWAVDRRIRELKTIEPNSLLARLASNDEGGEARHLKHAIDGADTVANELLRSVSEDLAFGLSHVVHLMHPEAIVLGGGLSLIGEPLRCAVAEALAHFMMDAFAPGPDVMLAALREDAVPVGALLLAASSSLQ